MKAKLQQKKFIGPALINIIVSFDRRHFDHSDHVVSRKKKVPFSMALKKWGAHARVFSLTLADGSSKTEIRLRSRQRRQGRRECGNKQRGHEKNKSRRIIPT